jgi:hypothetical protein
MTKCHGLYAPYSSPTSIAFILNLIKGIDLLEAAKCAFQVVYQRARREGLGAVWRDARAEVNVVVDGGFFLGRVCEV